MYFPVWPLPCSLPSSLPCLVIICEFIPTHISSNETNLIMASMQPWIKIGCSLCGALWNNYNHCFTYFVCGVAGQKTYCFHCWKFKNKWKKKPKTSKQLKPQNNRWFIVKTTLFSSIFSFLKYGAREWLLYEGTVRTTLPFFSPCTQIFFSWWCFGQLKN